MKNRGADQPFIRRAVLLVLGADGFSRSDFAALRQHFESTATTSCAAALAGDEGRSRWPVAEAIEDGIRSTRSIRCTI
jgi:pyruvate dehydrogenase complex dehydrogenase (E1) component